MVTESAAGRVFLGPEWRRSSQTQEATSAIATSKLGGRVRSSPRAVTTFGPGSLSPSRSRDASCQFAAAVASLPARQ